MVFLTKIEKEEESGKWVQLPYYDTIEFLMPFSGHNNPNTERDLVRDVEYYVDICKSCSSGNRLWLDLKFFPEILTRIVQPAGKYRLTTYVIAEEADTITVVLDISWGGDYKNLSSNLVSVTRKRPKEKTKSWWHFLSRR